jgi:hypothetical protein
MAADQKFIDFMEDEMSWNGAKVTYLEEEDTYMYECLPGSGVTRYLKEACKKFGVTTKITRGMEQSRRSFQHDYYIKILRYL